VTHIRHSCPVPGEVSAVKGTFDISCKALNCLFLFSFFLFHFLMTMTLVERGALGAQRASVGSPDCFTGLQPESFLVAGW
jgi:hypothetical protein